MKPENMKKFESITMAGLFLQLLFAAISTTITLFWNYPALQHLMWHSIAPLGIWVVNLITVSSRNSDTCTAGNSFKSLIIKLLYRYGSTVSGLFMITFFLLSFTNILPSLKPDTSVVKGIPAHLPLILFSVVSFSGILISIYYIKISALEPWKHLQGVAQYLASTTLFFLILLINSLFKYSGFISIDNHITVFLKSINAILAAELLIIFLSSFFKPPSSANRQRSFYHSYILEVVLYPQKTTQTIRLLLINLSGFDITAHAFSKQIQSVILPLLAASGIFMFLLSSFVIIRPEEKGILFTLGRPDPHTLAPGIHLKPPFPFGKVRKFDVFLIRQMHVGSHKPQIMGGTVFKEGVPLLWTTNHGLSNDEHLIVASPRKLMQNAVESGGKVDVSNNKTPSVSLAGADIVLEYTINNITDFSMAGIDTEKMLYLFSEASVSHHLLSFDIDTLFSDARIGMAQELKARLQSKISNHHLGIKILNVSITAVHPPTEIADVFEENVTAMQERETKFQQAQQSSLRTQVEAAGSVAAFKELADQINIEERFSSAENIQSELMILKCGGTISTIISDATGYRWSRENIEGGKAEKFTEELKLFEISKNIYSHERYFSILEEALASKNKILVSQRHKNLIVELGSTNRLIPDNILRGSNQ
ncbi:MAG: hypothetical protein JW915_04420 [Chitinispirillaceae bacterium]|nr:hypothetical protein [Chitinispirillaceae bacterium]